MPAPKATSKELSQKGHKTDPSNTKSEIGIKYTDKSPGQPGLVPVFDEIKRLLTPYAKGTIKILASPGKVTLISKKPVEILGRRKEEVWFASALVQKGYVGFYYMPVYGDTKLKELIKPELLKCLKGKACFHIKKFDKQIFSQIEEALRMGYDLWHERGWL